MSITTKGWKYGHRTVGTAVELGIDEGDPEFRWGVICEDHYTCTLVPTKADAMCCGTQEFCGCCNGNEEYED